MSRWISTHIELIPLYTALSDYDPLTCGAQLVMEFENGIPIAGALYDHYNEYSLHSHIWIAFGHKPSRVWWWAIHHYPFRVAKVKHVYGVIRSTNTKALRLAKSMGYEYVSMLPDYFAPGEACLFFLGTEETARFWKPYRDGKAPPKYHDKSGLLRMPQ